MISKKNTRSINWSTASTNSTIVGPINIQIVMNVKFTSLFRIIVTKNIH